MDEFGAVTLLVQSILDTIGSLFVAPDQLEKQCAARARQLNLSNMEGVLKDAAAEFFCF